MIFLVHFYLLLVHENRKNFMLILYPATLLNFFINLIVYLIILDFLCIELCHLIYDRACFSFFPKPLTSYFFSFLITYVRTSRTVLNSSANGSHIFLLLISVYSILFTFFVSVFCLDSFDWSVFHFSNPLFYCV